VCDYSNNIKLLHSNIEPSTRVMLHSTTSCGWRGIV